MLQNTPVPGAYETHDLLYELNAVPINKTYGFKSSGRKTRADPSRCGEYLMPGMYKTNDFSSNLQKMKLTYAFKGTNRENKHGVYIGVQDKDIIKSDISPTKYNKEFEPVKKSPSTYDIMSLFSYIF